MHHLMFNFVLKPHCRLQSEQSKRALVPCAGQALDKDTILAHPCDVLIPAAIGGVLDETTAKDVQVSLIRRLARFHADDSLLDPLLDCSGLQVGIGHRSLLAASVPGMPLFCLPSAATRACKIGPGQYA